MPVVISCIAYEPDMYLWCRSSRAGIDSIPRVSCRSPSLAGISGCCLWLANHPRNSRACRELCLTQRISRSPSVSIFPRHAQTGSRGIGSGSCIANAERLTLALPSVLRPKRVEPPQMEWEPDSAFYLSDFEQGISRQLARLDAGGIFRLSRVCWTKRPFNRARCRLNHV